MTRRSDSENKYNSSTVDQFGVLGQPPSSCQSNEMSIDNFGLNYIDKLDINIILHNVRLFHYIINCCIYNEEQQGKDKRMEVNEYPSCE